MIELVEFLRARYDEREQAARAVEGIRLPWYFDHIDDAARPFVETVLDPASVLADLAAKGEILDYCESVWDDGTSGAQLAQFTLRQFARPYDGHPDYRSEWAVTE